MRTIDIKIPSLSFGTDGVRGIANEKLSPELAMLLGQGGGSFLGEMREKRPVVIGRDTRASGELLESALAAGLMSVGVDVCKAGVLPTPAVAFLVKELGMAGGVVISASHNPAEYNGIKFFGPDGEKLDDDQERAIQERMGSASLKSAAGKVGTVFAEQDEEELYRSYFQHLLSSIDGDLAGIKMVIDCSNGACFRIAPELFGSLGMDVVVMADNPDGANINRDCGSTHLEGIQKKVLESGAALGLAFDGDGDRVLAVDEKGEVVDGDQIMRLCALHLRSENRLPGNRIVGTVMSNLGLEVDLRSRGIEMTRSDVGDRYVMEEMKKTGSNLGGEQSGHVIIRDRVTTGDGLLTALEFLASWTAQGGALSEACGFRRYPQVLVNVEVSDRDMLHNNMDIWDFVGKKEGLLGTSGRVLLRPSGTEPLIRVMVEAETQESAVKTADEIAEKVVEKIGGNIRGR